MFGLFRVAKFRTKMFLETNDALKKYASIDLSKMPAREQGSFGDAAIDLLYAYQKKSSYTSVELIISGWHTILSESNTSSHSLYGARISMVRGFADYLLSGNVIYSHDFTDDRYFPPFFTSFVKNDLKVIQGETSSGGRSIIEFISKI